MYYVITSVEIGEFFDFFFLSVCLFLIFYILIWAVTAEHDIRLNAVLADAAVAAAATMAASSCFDDSFACRQCYNGLVKLAGNNPFSVEFSFSPISHPSSWKSTKTQQVKKWLGFSWFLPITWWGQKMSYLIFWIIVFNDSNGVANLETELINVFLNIFIGGLDSIQNTWW